MSIFCDTGVLFAAAMRRDARHARAAALLKRVAAQSPFTTDHVLVETWVLLRHRTDWRTAMRFWLGLRDTPLRMETVALGDLDRAQAIAESWKDQAFDIVDCTSLAVMERLGCHRAASFDHDFAIYRYGPDRVRALDVLS